MRSGGVGGEVEREDQQSRVLYELCAMISHVLQTPPLPISFPGLVGPAVSSLSSRTSQASPAAFASLFLGISVALMLFGSVTFVIGFFLMPLVIGLVMLFYFVGMLYNLSVLGRTILWPDCSTTTAVPEKIRQGIKKSGRREAMKLRRQVKGLNLDWMHCLENVGEPHKAF